MGYTKMFSSILDSTVWDLPLPTKIVWITMMAMADRHGEVAASVPGLAKRAGVTLEQCQEALKSFMSPDPHSRTKDAEGRRIEEIDGGWALINHRKYTQKLSAEDKKDRAAVRQRRHRDKIRGASAEDISRRDGYVCGICANPVEPCDAEVDHIIPRSKGGPDGIDNLQLAHPFCNQSKHNGRNGLLRHASLSPVTLLQSNKTEQGHDTQTQTHTETKTKTRSETEAKKSLASLGAPVTAQSLLAVFHEEWTAAYDGESYAVSRKDAGWAANVAATPPFATNNDFRAITRSYLGADKDFFRKARHPFYLLASNLNEFKGPPKSGSTKVEQKFNDNLAMWQGGQDWAEGK